MTAPQGISCEGCREKRDAMAHFLDGTIKQARVIEDYFNDPKRGDEDPEGNAELIDALHGWIAELEEARQHVRAGRRSD